MSGRVERPKGRPLREGLGEILCWMMADHDWRLTVEQRSARNTVISPVCIRCGKRGW